jgi:hypothetical protein
LGVGISVSWRESLDSATRVINHRHVDLAAYVNPDAAVVA